MPPTATVPRPVAPSTFKFFTRDIALKIEKAADGSEQLFIEGCASSTVIDRCGDRISLACQQKFLEQCKSLTIFLNHSYDVPEDVMGTCEESYLKQATDAEQGECTELWIRCKVAMTNPRAVEAARHITAGVRLGFSVGGRILDYEFADLPDGDWVFVITDMALWEISVVGIPANQRAYIEQEASKALRKSLGFDFAPKLAAALKADAEAKRDAFRKAAAAPPAVSPRMVAIAKAFTPEQRAASPEVAKIMDEILSIAGETADPAPAPKAAAADVPARKGQATVDELRADRLQLDALPPVVVALKALDFEAFVDALRATVQGRDEIRDVQLSAHFNNAHPYLWAIFSAIKAASEDDPDDVATGLSDEQTKCVMDAASHIVAAAKHGVCPQAGSSLQAAHQKLADLVPEESDYPVWESASVDPALAIAQLADLEERLAKLAPIVGKLEEKRLELAEIETRILTLGAIPLGRRTSALAGGSYGTRTADPAFRARGTHEIVSDLRRANRGDTGDARSRSIR